MQPARSSPLPFPAAQSPSAARRGATGAIALGLCALGAGCFVGDQALPPPAEALYYPTGLARSPGGSTLYVTNSDFDLQYDGGTVLALDLVKMRTKLDTLLDGLRQVAVGTKPLDQACRDGGTSPNPDPILNPGPCVAISLATASGGNPPSATIGAFASGAIFVKRNGNPDARVFIPVRGDPSITFVDVDADDLGAAPQGSPPLSPGAFSSRLDCTGSSVQTPGARCNNEHRIGVEPFESSRAIVLPTEPVGIAASEDGTAIVVAHQTEKSVSLSVDDPERNTPTVHGVQNKPSLSFVLGGLPDGPTDVATVPIPALFKARVEKHPPEIDYQRGFLITYRASPVVDLIRVHKDESGTSRPFLTRSNDTAIGVNADGKDSRGIAVDGEARHECEDICGQAAATCTKACANQGCNDACAAVEAACQLPCLKIPIDIFIANRTPPSLLIGRLETTTIPEESTAPTGAFDRVFITDSIPLAQGASKVVVGKVIDAQGKLSRRVFASAFDSRLVFSYDPQARRVDNIIKTGRGPHALAFDYDGTQATPEHAFLIVGHFTDSYLGVVDLDMRHPETFGTMFASVGTPTPPKASK